MWKHTVLFVTFQYIPQYCDNLITNFQLRKVRFCKTSGVAIHGVLGVSEVLDYCTRGVVINELLHHMKF